MMSRPGERRIERAAAWDCGFVEAGEVWTKLDRD